MTPPDVNPAAGAARQALLDWIDGLIARSPAEWQPGLMGIRAEIEAGSVLPVNMVGAILKHLGDSILSGDFGPASHSDADLA